MFWAIMDQFLDRVDWLGPSCFFIHSCSNFYFLYIIYQKFLIVDLQLCLPKYIVHNYPSNFASQILAFLPIPAAPLKNSTLLSQPLVYFSSVNSDFSLCKCGDLKMILFLWVNWMKLPSILHVKWSSVWLLVSIGLVALSLLFC